MASAINKLFAFFQDYVLKKASAGCVLKEAFTASKWASLPSTYRVQRAVRGGLLEARSILGA